MNSGFITQTKDKNGDSWYHQIVVETQQQEIERLNKRIKELEEGFKASTEDLCEESTKIEKAIEYIKQKEINVFYQELGLQQINAKKELLEILKGSE